VRSPRGFWGSIFILLAVPVAVLTQVLFGGGSGIAVHSALMVGCVLVSFALFDFRVPRWITWVGSAAVGALAAIFFLQAVSPLVGSGAFFSFAYEVLGSWPERLLVDLFLFWLVSMLLVDSRDRTRAFGFVAVAVVICLEVYEYVLLLLGSPPGAGIPGSRALYLLPVAWLLLESRKKRSEKDW